MVKSRYIGDGHPTFNRNPCNGYINPYYWVDDHPLLYGNNGSLDRPWHTWNLIRELVGGYLSNLWRSHVNSPSLKLTAKAAENGWLEYDRFLLGWPIFRVDLLVSGRVTIPKKVTKTHENARRIPGSPFPRFHFACDWWRYLQGIGCRSCGTFPTSKVRCQGTVGSWWVLCSMVLVVRSNLMGNPEISSTKTCDKQAFLLTRSWNSGRTKSTRWFNSWYFYPRLLEVTYITYLTFEGVT